jgi:ribosomal protein L34E
MAEELTTQEESVTCAQCGKNITDTSKHTQYRFSALNGQAMEMSHTYCSYECGRAYAATLAEKASR